MNAALDFESLYIRARPGSPIQERAARAIHREEQLEQQEHDGHYSPLLEHAEQMETAAGQLRLELTDYDTRANVRAAVADYLDSVVLPGCVDPKLRRLPEKLRAARRRCWFQLDTVSGATRTLWDQKAGEPLLCPDDAREEAMRLQRRLEQRIEELARAGYRVYYGVLTIENAAPGGLQARAAKLWRKWQRALKARVPSPPGRRIAARRRARLFPIIGAIATLEAPLGSSRTWHPHLNVIAITRGFFDWSAWWAHWGDVSDWQPIKGGAGSVAAAFRELIKYSVRAVPEKSAAKARQAHQDAPGGELSAEAFRTPPPAMVEWSAPEWLEWWGAMKGRRRTRTYGELFGLNVEVEELDQAPAWVTFGSATWTGTRYAARFPLLESIPGDKSIRDPKARKAAFWAEATGPPVRWAILASELAAWRAREASQPPPPSNFSVN